MNQIQFNEEISVLEDSFVGRVPEKFRDAKQTWWERLQGYSLPALRKAISDICHTERFPVLAQVQAECNRYEPTKAEGYLMNFSFCYKPMESDRMKCGCPECHPEFWCKVDQCKRPVSSRMKPMAGMGRSIEYCFEHLDGQPPA